MPTTLVSLAIFIVLLVPGFAYQGRRERDAPQREWSVLRETLSVAVAGLGADAVVLAAAVLVWLVVPGSAPDIAALVRAPGQYVAQHYTEVVLWSVGLLVAATLFAYGVASGPVQRWFDRRRPHSRRRAEAQQSAWWLLFNEHPDSSVHVGCVLDDDSYVAGWLHSYSRVSAEHGDRELTLRGPITYRPSGTDETTPLPNVNAIAVSARQLRLLFVSYVRPPAD